MKTKDTSSCKEMEAAILQLKETKDALEQYKTKLLRTETLLKNIGKMAKIGEWELDTKTMKFNWTDEIYQLHELPLNWKPYMKDAIRFIHPDDRSKLEFGIQRSSSLGESWDEQVRFYTATGEQHWARLVCHPGKSKDNRFTVKGIFQDITDLKETECRLKESEERYKTFFRENHSIMLMIDPDTADILDANPAALSFYGWTYDQITQKKITEINTAPKQEILRLMKKAKVGKGKPFFFCHRLSDGEIRDVEVNSSAMILSGKKILCSIIFDITDRKKIAKQLYRSRQKYQQLVENINPFTFIFNRLPNNVVTYVSPSVQQVIGLSPENIINKNWQDLLKWEPESIKKAFPIIQNLNAVGDSSTYDLSFFHLDGTLRTLHITSIGITDTEGNIIRIEGVATDVTDRKKNEMKQEQLKKLLENKVSKRTAELEELNTALKVLLQKREEEQLDQKQKIFQNYKLLVQPLLAKLKTHHSTPTQQLLIEVLESNFEEIFSSFSNSLSNPMRNLSPKEIQIAGMIKQGLSNKEIAQILNKSVRTITTHRENIRKKFSLINKKVNLRNFLSSL